MSCVMRVMEQLVQGSAQSKAVDPWDNRSLLLGAGAVSPREEGGGAEGAGALGQVRKDPRFMAPSPLYPGPEGTGLGGEGQRDTRSCSGAVLELCGVPHELVPSMGTCWECLVPILAARSALKTQIEAMKPARDEFLG